MTCRLKLAGAPRFSSESCYYDSMYVHKVLLEKRLALAFFQIHVSMLSS